MTKEVVSAKKEKTGTVTNPATDKAAKEKIIVSRISLLFSQPFFGNIATRLQLVNADDWCPTAATDGRNLYYNSEFVNKLKDKEVTFLVGHELLHCIYDHVGLSGRCGHRIPQLWNIAADYAINRDLIDQRIGERITTVPTLFDPKYKGMASEEIYDSLYENAEKIDMQQLAKQLLDEHLDGDQDGDGEGDGDEEGEGKGRPKLSAEEKQAIADELKEAMLAAAQSVQPGQIPAGIRRYIDGLTECKMDWRSYLQQQIDSQIKNDFTFMKPSRRGWGCDAILPSMKKEPTIELSVFLDLSGSIGQTEMRDFMSEIVGICGQYSGYKITIGTWDTDFYYTGEFTEDDGIDAIVNATYKGGGGTDPTCIWKWCEENDHNPKQAIIFTDGYVSSWGEEYADKFSTIWLMYKNQSAKAPHGETLHYE
jgi:predicted metal-dependent peptidase